MKTAIATVSLGSTLREKLEAIAAAGFDGVEIFATNILAHDGPPKKVGTLVRDLNIRYDEDGNGRYFQVYTRVFAERFFFEIVARQGYLGLGAPNAPIHLTAQARLSRHPTVAST